MDGDRGRVERGRGSGWLLLVVLAWPGLLAEAATAYKCTGPTGRTTFSDQPCPEAERTDEVKLRGQPLIGGPDGAPTKEGEEAAEEGKDGAEQPAAEEPVEDVRAPRLRRLDFLLNQLFSGLNGAGEDCKRATAAIDGWVERHGNETRGLYAAWDEVRFEKLNLKQKELEAMRTRLERQFSQLKSVTLPKLNAKCWNDRQLGAAFDRLQAYLPGS